MDGAPNGLPRLLVRAWQSTLYTTLARAQARLHDSCTLYSRPFPRLDANRARCTSIRYVSVADSTFGWSEAYGCAVGPLEFSVYSGMRHRTNQTWNALTSHRICDWSDRDDSRETLETDSANKFQGATPDPEDHGCDPRTRSSIVSGESCIKSLPLCLAPPCLLPPIH